MFQTCHVQAFQCPKHTKAHGVCMSVNVSVNVSVSLSVCMSEWSVCACAFVRVFTVYHVRLCVCV